MHFILLFASTAVLGSNEFGLKFLEENKVREGVITLDSGLQYKVLREGDGDEHPLASTSCSCHYEGRTAQSFPEGKTFDSSYARGDPTSFAPNQVIKGWTEAMQLMVQGDKWEMYIPSELGYGEGGSGADIKGGDVLVFTMEILEINGPTTPANRGPPAYTELATAADYDAWNGAAAASGQKVVGVFRKLNSKAELSGKFFNAFKAASKVVAKAGGAAGIITHSVFDGKSGKYQPEAIIEEFAASDKYPTLKAPNVYVQSTRTGKWKKCKTNKSADDLKDQIINCSAKKKKKSKKTKGAAAAAEATEGNGVGEEAAAAAGEPATKDEL